MCIRDSLEAWLERVLEWQPLMKKEKPWKLVARWEEAYGSSQSLERLRNTAVFHSTIDVYKRQRVVRPPALV